jgi:hypothetical protein
MHRRRRGWGSLQFTANKIRNSRKQSSAESALAYLHRHLHEPNRGFRRIRGRAAFQMRGNREFCRHRCGVIAWMGSSAGSAESQLCRTTRSLGLFARPSSISGSRRGYTQSGRNSDEEAAGRGDCVEHSVTECVSCIPTRSFSRSGPWAGRGVYCAASPQRLLFDNAWSPGGNPRTGTSSETSGSESQVIGTGRTPWWNFRERKPRVSSDRSGTGPAEAGVMGHNRPQTSKHPRARKFPLHQWSDVVAWPRQGAAAVRPSAMFGRWDTSGLIKFPGKQRAHRCLQRP